MNWAHITSLIYVRVGGQFSDSVDVSRFLLFNVFFFGFCFWISVYIGIGSSSSIRRSPALVQNRQNEKNIVFILVTKADFSTSTVLSCSQIRLAEWKQQQNYRLANKCENLSIARELVNADFFFLLYFLSTMNSDMCLVVALLHSI